MTDTRPQAVFNHNDFHHRYLLRQVPSGCGRALDVGCGTGLFARRLAQRAHTVEAVDRAPDMVAQAHALSNAAPNVRYIDADIADYDLASSRYDFISCIATIHHMPFTETITMLREALAPGGVLAIVGCYRESTLADHLSTLISAPANIAANTAVKMKTRYSELPIGQVNTAPVMDPRMTIPEIKREAARLLPGVVIRRRLFWRYSLIYQRPASQSR
jgi:SAM-dependent methyltransferase